jgi:hypothetical protein
MSAKWIGSALFRNQFEARTFISTGFLLYAICTSSIPYIPSQEESDHHRAISYQYCIFH